MRCAIGHSYVSAGGLGDFTVTVSNPSGTVVKFTLNDTGFKLTLPRVIQMVLRDAIDQWLATNRAALDAHGDSAVKGPLIDVPPTQNLFPGFGYARFDWNYGGKYAQVTLVTVAYVTVTGNITASVPYQDAC